MSKTTIKRALLSVSDKTGIVEFAQQLHALNIELLSTGGTAKLLKQHHIPVIDVSDYTGFPEILDGRVKTLHPKIYGGLLSRRDSEDDAVLQQHQISPIDLVAVNLYPFEKTIAQSPHDLLAAIENIDIGGPCMLRAAAKNFAAVTIITDNGDYQHIIKEIQDHQGATTENTRFELAQKAFAHVAHYDAIIANYFNAVTLNGKHLEFPQNYTLQFHKKQDLRYGENPHQKAAFYAELNAVGIASAQQLQGKELSFNNIADADAALECVQSFAEPACVIVKHANPCGVAVAQDLVTAYQKAFACDSTSAFGGIIAFNRPLTAALAKIIIEQQFVEVIIAPEIANDALQILQQKSAIRVLSAGIKRNGKIEFHYQRVSGGLLMQERDHLQIDNKDDLKVVTQRAPTTTEFNDLIFAWKVVKYVKSNAIVFVKDQATIGIGAGQMSRVDSVEIAIRKAARANLSTQSAVMASDAFFPFRDGIEAAVKAGITAIIQPGGSIRDNEVIQAADEADVAMVFTGIRHFRH